MAPVASSSRKRKTPVAESSTTPQQPLETLTGNLELGADSDENDDDDDEAGAGGMADSEEDDDEDEFPELDIGSSDDDEPSDDEVVPALSRPRGRKPAGRPTASSSKKTMDDEADDESDPLEEDEGAVLTDEEDGSQSGYNSSDIDDEPFGSPSTTSTSLPRSSSSRLRSSSPMSRFIAEHTVKPDERDHAVPEKPEDELAGKMVISELTGRPKRVYRDVEAGYGSESSTEDVRF